jgi:two-component system cell cycle response regulator CpdR
MAETSRILIVDDEPQIRELLALAFENASYAVRMAGSGRDAIVLCAEESFDFVLSDVMMPEMDGHELTQWIATNRPGTRTALMSGFDDTSPLTCRPRCHLIAKPFHPQQVVSFVQQVLAAS